MSVSLSHTHTHTAHALSHRDNNRSVKSANEVAERRKKKENTQLPGEGLPYLTVGGVQWTPSQDSAQRVCVCVHVSVCVSPSLLH